MPLFGDAAAVEYHQTKLCLLTPRNVEVMGLFHVNRLKEICAVFEKTGEWPSHAEQYAFMEANTVIADPGVAGIAMAKLMHPDSQIVQRSRPS